MRRRDLLGAVAAGGTLGVAGCGGLLRTRSAREPPLPDPRPNAVYVPTHVEGMGMVGSKESGRYRCALAFTFPHRFWLIKPNGRTRVDVQSDDSVHLMPVVWDAETGIVPPDVNPQLSVARDGESVAQLAPWPMLSQPMGFHFGDNVSLDGDGTYDVEASVGSPSIRRTGSLAGADGGASFAFEFEFAGSTLEALSFRDIPSDREGTRGAVEPMEMATLPSTRAPAPGEMPGTVRGEATSGDARFVVATLPDAEPFGDEEGTYLVVSPRTPYNRYVLPAMSLSATLARGSETVYDDVLRPAIDPELRYHYGAVVPGVDAGDELTITVDSPPQVARHEGYETAFLDMDATTLSL